MARPFPVYPPQLAFLGTIDGTNLLRRAWSGQELPPVYFGVGSLDDAQLEAESVGLTAVWFRGRVFSRVVVDGGELVWQTNDGRPMPSGGAAVPVQQSLIGAWS